jgi:hypothetical protein
VNRARGVLERLMSLGLRSVTFSTDRYHLPAVPVEHIRWALEAARATGLKAAVKIARLARDPIAEGLHRALQKWSDRILLQEISPLGRGSSLRQAVHLRSPWSFAGPGCSTPPVLLPDGNLLTCCNLPARDVQAGDFPFVVGNVREESLGALLKKRSEDPLLAFLRLNGPTPLLSLLRPNLPRATACTRAGYHSRCDLCFHLFHRIRDTRALYAAIADWPREGQPASGVVA